MLLYLFGIFSGLLIATFFPGVLQVSAEKTADAYYWLKSKLRK